MNAAELVRAFIAYLTAEQGASSHTVEAYRRDLEQFLRTVRDGLETDPADLRTDDVERFVSLLRESRLTPATISRKVAAIRSFARFAHAGGYLPRNFAEDVEPRRAERKLPVVPSPRTIARLLGQRRSVRPLDVRNRAMLELLYGSGLRVSELTSLCVADIDFQNGLLRCSGKGGKERMVPVGRPALRWLVAVVATNTDTSAGPGGRVPLFQGRRGRPLTRQAVWRTVRREALRCGIRSRVSPHTLRHGFATHMLARGADLRLIQELLGHARVTTTEIYTHLDRSHLRRVYRNAHPRAMEPPH